MAGEANVGGRAGCKVWKNEGWDKGGCRADLHTKMWSDIQADGYANIFNSPPLCVGVAAWGAVRAEMGGE